MSMMTFKTVAPRTAAKAASACEKGNPAEIMMEKSGRWFRRNLRRRNRWLGMHV